eukprot:GHVQ01039303.1.p1 GENE.GHVQ01039303.1~~GHVQ01039303.1.p1  ORF type:complete len:564 (-),score=35.45 GHVQ01039303.1:678-2369(-)
MVSNSASPETVNLKCSIHDSMPVVAATDIDSHLATSVQGDQKPDSSWWQDLKDFYYLFRSLIGRGCAFSYMASIWWIMFDNCRPNYLCFFAYLTNWGLTLCLVYFSCALLHDIRRRYRRSILVAPVGAALRTLPRESATLVSGSSCTSATTKELGQLSNSSPLPVTLPSTLPCPNLPPSYYYTYYETSCSVRSLWWKIFEQSVGELAFVVQVVVVSFFWIVVFPHEPSRPIWWEMQTHGMGLVLMLLDYAYRKFHRFSLRNHKWILLFGFSYLVCHFFVVILSGEPVYPGIHFRDLRSFLITISALSTLVITHKLVYLYSNWDRIQFEVQSIFRVIYLVILGVETLEVSPLISLWNMLNTTTDWTNHPYFKTSNTRQKRQLQFIYEGYVHSSHNRLLSGYTGKWTSSRSSSIGTDRLLLRRDKAEGADVTETGHELFRKRKTIDCCDGSHETKNRSNGKIPVSRSYNSFHDQCRPTDEFFCGAGNGKREQSVRSTIPEAFNLPPFPGRDKPELQEDNFVRVASQRPRSYSHDGLTMFSSYFAANGDRIGCEAGDELYEEQRRS